MSRAPTRPGQPLEPVTAVCAARYFADLVPAHAFVFRLPSTDSRFTLYTADPDRYLIGATYTLTLAEPGERSLSLTPRTGSCSRTASNGWPNGGPTPSSRPRPATGTWGGCSATNSTGCSGCAAASAPSWIPPTAPRRPAGKGSRRDRHRAR